MKQIQTHGPSTLKTYGLLVAGLVLGLSSISALAAGVASGTTVNNQASLSYSVGGVTQTAILSDGDTVTAGVQQTAFVVDNKVNLTVVEVGAAFTPVVPGQTGAVTTFTVTNNGNTVQDYSLASTNLATGQLATPITGADNFDTTGCAVFVESNAVADGYQVGTDTATFIDELLPDANKTVYVVCTIPAAQVNNDIANVSLTATTRVGGAAGQGAVQAATVGANTAGVDVVFADVAGTDDTGTSTASPAVPGVRDGTNSARDQYKVVTATLAVTKTVTPICDPSNGNTNPKNIPGADVQYAITIANTGGSAATLTQITDAVVAQLGFDSKLNAGTGGGASCAIGLGTSLSASGFGAVTGVGVGPGVVAPGLAAHAVTAGATSSSISPATAPTITITFATLATSAIVAPAGATLAAGSFITVYFNAFVQ